MSSNVTCYSLIFLMLFMVMEKNQQFNFRTNMTNIKPRRSPSPIRVPDHDVENSPLQMSCTQEFTDNMDVVWDWNSPQAKKQRRKCQKRLLLQSPKMSIKKHPSGDFEKLKEELKSLREELALPDHEESLQLSPREEAEYKSFNNGGDVDSLVHHLQEDEFDELMDENVNEQLFAFSQQVEEDLKIVENINNLQTSPNKKSISPKISFKKTSSMEKYFANDSFEDLLKTSDVKFLEDSPEKKNSSRTHFRKHNSTDNVSSHSIRTCSGTVEFYRTQSFEMATLSTTDTYSKTCTQDQIEKKRLEALAKLEAKRKLNRTVLSFQCSSEEIEQKRLQALAKVEAKRQQDIIERKRQEALKRLQMRRQKNVTSVKSSLATRLN